MTLLLDTCVLIWLTQEPKKLSAACRIAIDDPANLLVFSDVSAWEIHLKHRAGKLFLPEPPRMWIPQQLAIWGIAGLRIRLNSIHRTSDLPEIHRDPFDRMIIAQALEDSYNVVSPDEVFKAYGVPVIW
jgi:PIN domain nuclease of toxin-antitoxin system